GRADAVEEPERARRHDLPARAPPAPARGGRGELQQVLRRGLVELEHARERLHDLHRRVAVAPLLEAQVVVGADAGEQRHLLATQTRDAADARGGQPDVLRAYELATGSQVLPQLVVGHVSTVRRRHPALPGPPAPRSARAPRAPAGSGGASTPDPAVPGGLPPLQRPDVVRERPATGAVPVD